MKETFLMIFIIFSWLLFADLDFCDSSIIVIFKPEFSEFVGTRDRSFFGELEVLDIRNIFKYTVKMPFKH